MCRWLAYTGAPILMEELIFKPKDNLIQQSLACQVAQDTNKRRWFWAWLVR